ncbi:MAG: tyrosine-type recombinase/integrase [Desulfomonilaceae bacterium]
MKKRDLIAVPYQVPDRLPEKIEAESLWDVFFSGKSERTIEAYRRDFQDFRRFMDVESEREAVCIFLSRTPGGANSIALQYRKNLLERGLQATTVNRRLAALRSLSAMARTVGKITWKLEIKNQKTEAYRDTKGPGIDNFGKLLALVDARKDRKGIRDKAILRLLFDLGLRRGEATTLDVADLDMERKAIQVMGKGRTQKTELTLPVPTMTALTEWLRVRGQDPGPLFLNLDRAKKGQGRITGKSIYRLVRGLGEKIGIKTRPHGIRHTAVTQAVKRAQASGMDLEEVLDFSRHRDVRTLLIYRDRERNVQGKLSELISESV